MFGGRGWGVGQGSPSVAEGSEFTDEYMHSR